MKFIQSYISETFKEFGVYLQILTRHNTIIVIYPKKKNNLIIHFLYSASALHWIRLNNKEIYN